MKSTPHESRRPSRAGSSRGGPVPHGGLDPAHSSHGMRPPGNGSFGECSRPSACSTVSAGQASRLRRGQAVPASRSLPGWLRAGGGGRAAPTLALSRLENEMPTPACAQSHSFEPVHSRANPVAKSQKELLLPAGQENFQAGLRRGRVCRVASVVPPCAMRLPALRSASPVTHCPSSGLRKRSSKSSGMVLEIVL